MSVVNLSIPQAPRIRIFKDNGKHVARIALIEVVSPACDSEFEAISQAIAARQAAIANPETIIELLAPVEGEPRV